MDPTIADIFFDAFGLVPEYLIKVTGHLQATYLTNKWSRVKKQSPQSIHLLFRFGDQRISLIIEESNSNPAITFKYKGLVHSEKFNSLIWTDDTVSQVEYISSSADDINIRECLTALFREEHVNLKTLILKGWAFISTIFPDTISPEIQHLKRLEFYNCTFDLPVLNSLLRQFNSLDFVSLDNCRLKLNTSRESINMSTTSIGTMRISTPIIHVNHSSNTN